MPKRPTDDELLTAVDEGRVSWDSRPQFRARLTHPDGTVQGVGAAMALLVTAELAYRGPGERHDVRYANGGLPFETGAFKLTKLGERRLEANHG